MGDAVHREQIGPEDPVVGVNEVDPRFPDPSVREIGEAGRRQKLGKREDRNLVKPYAIGTGNPAVGEDVELPTGIAGKPLREFRGKAFRPPTRPYFGITTAILKTRSTILVTAP